MSDAKFTTVINCMDGRTQLQVNEYLRNKYQVDYVDTVTEPGPIKILAEGDVGDQLVKSIFDRVDISVHKHGSTAITVVAHHDCAGNPVEESIQKAQAVKAVEALKSRYTDCTVSSVWIGENWQVEEIC